MTAARTGDIAAIRVLIAHGADVNSDLAGQTALMWAAARNNAGVVRALIGAGAEVHTRTPLREAPGEWRGRRTGFAGPEPTSYSALMFAVRAGAREVVWELLDAGADVNDTLSDGQSALMMAVANGHSGLADFLLDRGADPTLAGPGWNALHQAVRTRRPNYGQGTPGPIPTGSVDSLHVIKKMIAHGVNVNARMTKHGLKGGQRNRFNRLGATAFVLAAKVTDTEVMHLLVEAGADPGIPTAEGTTALMVAAGVDIFAAGTDGGSLRGQESEVLEAIEMCVTLGNDVNATNIYRETALHGAALRGVDAVVEFLVDRGARLDARDERGWTPWSLANGFSLTSVFRDQPATAALLRRLMEQRGVWTEGQEVDPRICHDCLETHPVVAREKLERIEQLEEEFAIFLTSRADRRGALNKELRRCASVPIDGLLRCEWGANLVLQH